MRKWITASLIVLAAVVLAFVRLPSPRQVAVFALPDGSVFEILKITFGPTHRFRADNRLRDVLGERLPAQARKVLGVRLVEITGTSSNSVVLWIHTRNRNGRARSFIAGWNSSRRGEFLQLGLADSHGVEADVIPSNARLFPTGSVNSDFFSSAWEFGLLPRHAKEFVLNFYWGTSDARRKLGELRLLNPAPADADTWLPEGLPAAKSLDDLTVKLLWAETSAGNTTSNLATSIGAELTRNGRPIADWQMTNLELFTEDGPVFYRARTLDSDPEKGQTATAISSGLWSDQPWKIRLWFERVANFPTNELWRLEDIPGMLPRERTQQRGEWEILISNDPTLIRPRDNGLPDLWRRANAGLCVVFRDSAEDGNGRITLMEAHDDRGRQLSLLEQPTRLDSALPTFRFALLPDAQNSTVLFAVHRARCVDFVVKPQLRDAIDPSRLPSNKVIVPPRSVAIGVFSM